ncbi:MAG TPA: hypothetical protein V6C97_03435 [Oculatellaceae cyanobacterium]
MEKCVFDALLATYVFFHRSIGLLVMIFLLLWMMSGRRLEPGSYTAAFFKTCAWVWKKVMKLCAGAAKETAARVPSKHAGWRPLVHFCAMCCYSVLTVATVAIAVTQCAQPPH